MLIINIICPSSIIAMQGINIVVLKTTFLYSDIKILDWITMTRNRNGRIVSIA